MFCCNRFFNLNTSCVPTCTTTCGPTVVVTCNDCCARVCSNVTFTVTITNTATCTINCASLHVLLPRAFCFNRGTVTVNGTAQENTVPECINIGTIEPSATVTITYRVTIMECTHTPKQFCVERFAAAVKIKMFVYHQTTAVYKYVAAVEIQQPQEQLQQHQKLLIRGPLKVTSSIV